MKMPNWWLRFRLWLIVLLAGDMPVALNLHIEHGTLVIKEGCKAGIIQNNTIIGMMIDTIDNRPIDYENFFKLGA